MRRTRNHRAIIAPVAALAVTLSAAAGCSNNWALGGLPGQHQPVATTGGARCASSGGLGLTGISGGGPELLGLVVVLGAVAAVALTIEGVRRLFGIPCR